MPQQTVTLTPAQLAAYEQDGYLLVRDAVREATLRLAQLVLDRWVTEMAEEWRAQGLLHDLKADLPFDRRLLVLWHDAGKPRYSRSPRRDLVSDEMFDVLAAPELVDIAQDLLGSPRVMVHSIFNARPKLPDQQWTDTPWHQDAQYFREAADVHAPTLWFPLHDVTVHNSCLTVEPGSHRMPLQENFADPSGFVGITPDVSRTFTGKPIEMKRGDVLCFTQRTAHAALPNRSDRVRWSMDIRYEAADTATTRAAELGFIARSDDPSMLTPRDAWLAKWSHFPRGRY